jgi:non-ribosomal peptide synthetase-like protein
VGKPLEVLTGDGDPARAPAASAGAPAASAGAPATSGAVPAAPAAVPATPAAVPDGCAAILAGILADLVHAEVPADSNFFDDLGADSMVMAHFCARVRKRPDLAPVSMKDIYQHPTIASLAATMQAAGPVPAPSPAPAAQAPAQAQAQAPAPASTRQYVLCGTLQLLLFLGYTFLAALVITQAYDWISDGSGFADIYLRAVLFGSTAFLVLCVLPIAAKWLIIGRWKPRQIQIWSLGYVRFWIVKILTRSSPLAFLFAGTPIYPLYLRALGARIGPGVAILSRTVPVCTDLLTIGAGTVIRKDSFFTCYQAHAGQLQTGTVTIGRDVFIGEKTVLDINTSMGDVAQLGHTTALYSGQAVPDGERWHGSPAQRTELDYHTTEPARCSMLRKARYCTLTLLFLLFVFLPLAEGGIYLVLTAVPSLNKLLSPGLEITSWALYRDALVLSLVLFFGAVIVGLLFVASVPRLLRRFVKPDTVYPLYGFRYRVHKAITRTTSIKFFNYLFGDSSYIVYYLRWIGYDLSNLEQTGSNFGTEVGHETPYLSSFGRGTMVADGLSIMNAEYSGTSFRLSRVSIGPRNFLGNNIAYPAHGRTGDNCLLATKAMIPIDGKIREGVGLLGSPSFEIPRSVERDSRFDQLRTGDELRRRLSAKNRYNLKTMAVFLFARWLQFFLIVLLGLAAIDLFDSFGQLALAGFFALGILVTPGYFILAERIISRFRPLQPKYCSIYDPYFWRHERLWKVPAIDYLHAFDGTPFKSLIWRLLGVRMGKRVFDDGAYLTERTLAAIGDDSILNAGSKIQCHSQEDGTFKSDRTTIGARCTLGVGAFVHYGVTLGDGAVLAPDSFLMKGEQIPGRARWGGNPAREMQP